MTPKIRHVVLDAVDIRPLAEFYRRLFDLEYRPGHERDEGQDWLVLRNPHGGANLAFQQVEKLERVTWPEGPIPQQLHLDFSVRDASDLVEQRERVLQLGGQLIYDRFDDPEEPLYVYADPAGHPFCIFVAP